MPNIQQRSPTDFMDLEHMPQRSAASHAIDRHDTPVRLAATLLYATGIFLLLLLLWAALTKVPEIAVAPGQIIPPGELKPIQPVADGVVLKVFVKEGQSVESGDKLVSLDRVPYAAELNKTKRELEIAQSELLEHNKSREALGSIIKDPGTLPKVQVDINNVSQAINDVYKTHSSWLEAQTDVRLSKNKVKLNDSRLVPVDSDMSMLSERLTKVLAQKRSSIDTLEERKIEFAAKKKGLEVESNSLANQLLVLKDEKETNDNILATDKEQEKRFKKLNEAGAIALMDLLNAEKVVQAQQLAILANNNEIVKTEHSLAEAKASLSEFQSKSIADLSQLASDIDKLSGDIAEVTMRIRERRRNMSLSESSFYAALEKAKALLAQESDEVSHQQARIEQAKSALEVAQYKFDRAEICAQVAGVVTSIKHEKGDVVSQKETLMTLVPTEATVVIEARLPNSDRGFVRAGQDVKLKFSSFPFQEYGILKGKLKEVESAPRDIDKLNGYYRVIIVPEKTYIEARGQRIPFAAGMSLSAEIITRHRSIMNILLEPIKNLQETRWN